MRSRTLMAGAANVPISLSSNASSDNIINNNVIITPRKEDNVETNPPKDHSGVPIYPSVDPTTFIPPPYIARDIKITDENNEYGEECVKDYLLKLYQSILLDNNKKLLANLIFKNTIVLTSEDLEIIMNKYIGKKVVISLVDPEVSCCAKYSPLQRISTILVKEGDSVNDFKYTYNNEYTKLQNQHKINMKYVLTN